MVFVGKFVLLLGKFGNFEIVSVENLVEFVCLSTNKKKVFGNIIYHDATVWWIKPFNFTTSVVFLFWT